MEKGRVYWRRVRGDRVLFGLRGHKVKVVVSKSNLAGLMMFSKALRIQWKLLERSLKL